MAERIREGETGKQKVMEESGDNMDREPEGFNKKVSSKILSLFIIN